MPRKNPLPEIEKAVGRRLAEARRDALIPRSALAVKLGISTDRLFSYEAGRAKVPWVVADQACKILDIHPSWLAGAKTLGGYVDYGIPPSSSGERERAAFTDVYVSVLRKRMAALHYDSSAQIKSLLADLTRAVDRAISNNVPIAEEQIQEIERIRDHVEKMADRMLKKPPRKE